ncbi:hypothetical protein H4S07_005392 [Coemansia furcata]|uniref:Uncharacterized protein n=1 Tax=Coemansia furcata TaxID=417177 RepID=A0ACC1L2L2_9FUNG|nr:hypothetical protein H4S07_005392 [Coemansia furcata]
MEAVQQIVGKAVDISNDQIAADQYISNEDRDTFVAIALGCLGGAGLGRILSLSGFANSCEVADKVWILDSTALYAKKSLAAAIAGTAPRSLKPNALRESPVESDAARMFRIMSKVAVPPPKAANVCASVLATLFAADVSSNDAIQLPLLLSLQITALATLQTLIASEKLVDATQGVARTAAREKITAEVAQLVPNFGLMADSQARGSERALLLWSALGVSFCGINKDRGTDLLKKAPGTLSDVDFGRLIEQQALLICRWIASTADISAKDMRPSVEIATSGTTGVIGDWLKSTFKEWARRIGHQPRGDDDCLRQSVSYSMQLVAGAVHGKRRVHCSSADMQKMVVQGLDMVILAASIAGIKVTASAGVMDEFIETGVVCWLLPLLTGLGAQDVLCQPSASASSDSRQALLGVAIGEMLEHMERSATTGQMVASEPQPARQYSVQLRTRVLGLLDLTQSAVVRRALRLVLVHLAQLGMLPLSDLQRVV